MVTEDYCSKDLYKLLLEKGFDGKVHTTYDEEGYTQPSISLYVAMKWLREMHNIVIEITSIWSKGFGYNYIVRIVVEGETKKSLKHYNYYEEACEAGIKYCLENLI